MNRSSGILMAMSSLPGNYGIGTMGKSAYKFVDFLRDSGQKYWQLLPLCPTSYGDSPYSSFSTFAGNPYLIDLDLLCRDKLLKKRNMRISTGGVIRQRLIMARYISIGSACSASPTGAAKEVRRRACGVPPCERVGRELCAVHGAQGALRHGQLDRVAGGGHPQA